jgi:hypothetical protein
MRTPWGSSDYQKQIAKGITRVSTPRHGGFYLSKERWAELMSIFPQFVSFAGKILERIFFRYKFCII